MADHTATLNSVREATAAARKAALQDILLFGNDDIGACGFARLTYRCRKNAPEAKLLVQLGFRHDDHLKCYYLSSNEWTNVQALGTKERICRAACRAAQEVGGGSGTWGVWSRID